MGTNYNSKIVTDGLVLYVDPANLKSNRGRRSLINWDSWVAGTVGSATGYGQNGDGNSRILDTNPFGVQDVVWDVSNQDATNDADGGWNTPNFPIDNTKMYRFSVWIRRKVIGNGSYYLGCYGKNSVGTNTGVLRRNTGVNETNPYFDSTTWTYGANTWVLFVGHVWPVNSGTGNQHPDSGRYLANGTKLGNINLDFVWNSDNVYSVHRSYLYYSTDTSTNQQFYQPRVDLCDGTEPTIAELLDDAGNKLYDLSLTGQPARFRTNTATTSLVINNENLGSIYFNGEDDKYATITYNPAVTDFSSGQTICMWLKPGTGCNSLRRNPYNQAYGGPGTITQEIGGAFNYYFGTNGGNSTPYVGRTSPFAVFDNELAFIAVTRDQTTDTMAWYKNGELRYTASAGGYASTANGTSPILLGDGYTTRWIGNIYNCMVYNRGLSADEIKTIFNAHRGRYGI